PFLLLLIPPPPRSPLFPYTTLFRSRHQLVVLAVQVRFPPRSHLGQLLGRRRRRGQLLQLVVDRVQHLPVGDLGRVDRGDGERVRVPRLERPEQARARADVGDQAVLVHQPLLQAGAVAVGQHTGQHQVGQVGVQLPDRV